MSKNVSEKNTERISQIGIAITAWRRHRGMSQEKMAEIAGITRSTLSNIESPHNNDNFSIDTFFNISDALDIDPAILIKGVYDIKRVDGKLDKTDK